MYLLDLTWSDRSDIMGLMMRGNALAHYKLRGMDEGQ